MRSERMGNKVRIHDGFTTYLSFVLTENLFQTPITITQTNETALDYSYNVQEKVEDTVLTWHKRLGHMSQSYMKHMVTHNLAQGIPFSKIQDFTCDDNHWGKMT